MENNIPPDSLQLRNEWFAEKQNHHRGSGDLLLLTRGSAIFKTPVISASKTESYRERSSTSLCVFHYPQRTHRHLRELLIPRPNQPSQAIYHPHLRPLHLSSLDRISNGQEMFIFAHYSHHHSPSTNANSTPPNPYVILGPSDFIACTPVSCRPCTAALSHQPLTASRKGPFGGSKHPTFPHTLRSIATLIWKQIPSKSSSVNVNMRVCQSILVRRK
ncbi:unnamed protein product [Leuciscus chuanchicus]